MFLTAHSISNNASVNKKIKYLSTLLEDENYSGIRKFIINESKQNYYLTEARANSKSDELISRLNYEISNLKEAKAEYEAKASMQRICSIVFLIISLPLMIIPTEVTIIVGLICFCISLGFSTAYQYNSKEVYLITMRIRETLIKFRDRIPKDDKYLREMIEDELERANDQARRVQYELDERRHIEDVASRNQVIVVR